jgi:hypothetical protein
MLYFIIDKLKMLDHMYQYSFLTFMGLVTQTIATTEGGAHHDEDGGTSTGVGASVASSADGYVRSGLNLISHLSFNNTVKARATRWLVMNQQEKRREQ